MEQTNSEESKQAETGSDEQRNQVRNPHEAALEIITKQLEQLHAEAEMLTRMSVQFEQLTAAAAKEGRSPAELAAIIAELLTVEESLSASDTDQSGQPPVTE